MTKTFHHRKSFPLNFITMQFTAKIGPHELGCKIPSVRPRQPRRRVPRPPPGFEDRHPERPPPPPPLPKQNKVILDLGARPKPTFDTVGRDPSNMNILLDASPRVLASAPLEQLDGTSAPSVEQNATPSRDMVVEVSHLRQQRFQDPQG